MFVRPTPPADRTTVMTPPINISNRARATPILTLRDLPVHPRPPAGPALTPARPPRAVGSAAVRAPAARPAPSTAGSTVLRLDAPARAVPAAVRQVAARAAAPDRGSSRGRATPRRARHTDGRPGCR